MVLFSKRAVKPVAESYERQKQFVTDANHELKTPLTLIRANLDILESETGPNEWLSDIREETALMSQLVGRLVTLARMDEENSQLEMQPFDLAEAVCDTASVFVAAAENSGKELAVQAPAHWDYTGERGGDPAAGFHPVGQRGEILRPRREHPGAAVSGEASHPHSGQHVCRGGGPAPFPAI